MTEVLHLITGLEMGGAERSLHTLLGQASRHSHSVVSLSSSGVYGVRIEALGVPVRALGMPRGAVSPAGLRALRDLMRDDPPRIVQGWLSHGNLAATFARRMAAERPALVWSIRGSLASRSVTPLRTRAAMEIARRLAGSPDAIVYNSTRARGEHEAEGYPASTGHVVPNGFDTGLWRRDEHSGAALRRELGIPPAAPVIGYVGRYHPVKDLPTLLRALGPVLAAHPEAHAVLVGKDTGPGNPVLATLHAGLPAGRLHAVGEQEDMVRWLSLFDLIALSSLSEGFPNVLGEAMACGVPAVSTEVGDASRILGETGRIVPRGDAHAMAAALGDMLALSPEERRALGERARQRITERFSLSAMIASYEELYDRLLA